MAQNFDIIRQDPGTDWRGCGQSSQVVAGEGVEWFGEVVQQIGKSMEQFGEVVKRFGEVA